MVFRNILLACVALSFLILSLYIVILMIDRVVRLAWMDRDRKKALERNPELPAQVAMAILEEKVRKEV